MSAESTTMDVISKAVQSAMLGAPVPGIGVAGREQLEGALEYALRGCCDESDAQRIGAFVGFQAMAALTRLLQDQARVAAAPATQEASQPTPEQVHGRKVYESTMTSAARVVDKGVPAGALIAGLLAAATTIGSAHMGRRELRRALMQTADSVSEDLDA